MRVGNGGLWPLLRLWDRPARREAGYVDVQFEEDGDVVQKLEREERVFVLLVDVQSRQGFHPVSHVSEPRVDFFRGRNTVDPWLDAHLGQGCVSRARMHKHGQRVDILDLVRGEVGGRERFVRPVRRRR